MSDYRNEDDWQIELRRLKADDKYKVCHLNCGFKLTTRSVICCCSVLPHSQISAVLCFWLSLRLVVNMLVLSDFCENIYMPKICRNNIYISTCT